MSGRGNTLEDIGRKAIEASLASTTWRRLRGVPCHIEPLQPCPTVTAVQGKWCGACYERLRACENHRRAKNTLLVAIRSYNRRNKG